VKTINVNRKVCVENGHIEGEYNTDRKSMELQIVNFITEWNQSLKTENPFNKKKVEIPKGWTLQFEDWNKIDNISFYLEPLELDWYEVHDYNCEGDVVELDEDDEQDIVFTFIDSLDDSKDELTQELMESYNNRKGFNPYRVNKLILK
jgi:hypothetical protein|tara:strand:- start:413 stop:856 length:444 start_codon:yes stop_codon:yes gene_type:complete